MKIRVNWSWQNIAGFLLAMTPFFRNYRLTFISINFATFWFLIITLIAFVSQILKKRLSVSGLSKSSILPVTISMTAYMLVEYYLIDIRKMGSGLTAGNLFELILYLLEIWCLLFVFCDCKVRESIKIHIVRISIIMSFIIYIQYILYYIFGVVLSKNLLIPFSGFYEPSVADNVERMEFVYNNLFRPSAFFLEPSHFAAYAVIALGIGLFENKSKKMNVFLTSTIVLSTSGLGIAAALLLWGGKAFLSMNSKSRNKVLKALVFCFFALFVTMILYNTVGIFRDTINRVLTQGDQNAITGRLWTSQFINQLSGKNVYWGAGFRNRPISDSTGLAYYMTGIVELVYCQGWFGTILFVIMMGIVILKMWKTKNALNFIVMGLFVAWFIFGNIVTPYYLVKYLAFTFYENTSLFPKGRVKCKFIMN